MDMPVVASWLGLRWNLAMLEPVLSPLVPTPRMAVVCERPDRVEPGVWDRLLVDLFDECGELTLICVAQPDGWSTFAPMAGLQLQTVADACVQDARDAG